jgi:hypothetical protein
VSNQLVVAARELAPAAIAIEDETGWHTKEVMLTGRLGRSPSG